VLRLVTSRRVRPHLLLDLCMIEQEKGSILFPPQRTLLYDTLRMCETVNWERCPVLFRSLEAVEALHRDLTWRIAWVLRTRKGVSYKRLPPPPFPGTELGIDSLSPRARPIQNGGSTAEYLLATIGTAALMLAQGGD
jgi:hypothetical protein